jgi:ABC-type amino acid transport substrate-binding protein
LPLGRTTYRAVGFSSRFFNLRGGIAMESIIQSLSKDEGILLGALLGSLALLAGTVISVAVTVAINWRMVRQTEDNNALKQSMLEMGMSADEIAKVVSATPERRRYVAFSTPKGRVRCQS